MHNCPINSSVYPTGLPTLVNLTTPLMQQESEDTPFMKNMEISAGYPHPYFFYWTLNGIRQENNSEAEFGYPSVIIHSLHRSFAGHYVLSATNHEVNGMVIGSFVLDILCK